MEKNGLERNYMKDKKTAQTITENNKIFFDTNILVYSVDENDLQDPLLLDNMREGVELLIQHIRENSKTLIIVDSDCDGFCSSAILMNYLNRFFPSWVQNKIYYFMHTGK